VICGATSFTLSAPSCSSFVLRRRSSLSNMTGRISLASHECVMKRVLIAGDCMSVTGWQPLSCGQHSCQEESNPNRSIRRILRRPSDQFQQLADSRLRSREQAEKPALALYHCTGLPTGVDVVLQVCLPGSSTPERSPARQMHAAFLSRTGCITAC